MSPYTDSIAQKEPNTTSHASRPPSGKVSPSCCSVPVGGAGGLGASGSPGAGVLMIGPAGLDVFFTSRPAGGGWASLA